MYEGLETILHCGTHRDPRGCSHPLLEGRRGGPSDLATENGGRSLRHQHRRQGWTVHCFNQFRSLFLELDFARSPQIHHTLSLRKISWSGKRNTGSFIPTASSSWPRVSPSSGARVGKPTSRPTTKTTQKHTNSHVSCSLKTSKGFCSIQYG